MSLNTAGYSKNGKPIVSIRNLRVKFETDSGTVIAVEDSSFDVFPGETVCLVGESGSGKSVTSLSLMRLEEFGGGKIVSGKLALETATSGKLDLVDADLEAITAARGKEIGMIFQEPMTSLNPVFNIGKQLTDGLKRHTKLTGPELRENALALLKEVRIPDPEARLKQYPHELSGGMRQRIVIAIAMACAPRLLIADEPTTALDVTIQAEILALINRLKSDHNMGVLFITHDMAVVAQMADRVVVMHQGKIVEEGSVDDIFHRPKQEYTQTLLAAVPKLGALKFVPLLSCRGLKRQRDLEKSFAYLYARTLARFYLMIINFFHLELYLLM